MEHLLSIQNLTKRFGKIVAVNNLSFTVTKGSVHGILGPNGSGKTTTLAMLLGIISPDSGSFNWFGQPLSTHSLKRIGAILETPNFYPYLSAVNNLKIVAQIKGVPDAAIDDVLQRVTLFDRRHSPFRTFSLGMKQRLAIASALLNNPEVLILDEPTNGLDPQGIAEVRELILKIASQGTTIVLASHLLDEVEKVCTDVVVMKSGEALYNGKVSGMMAEEDVFELASENMKALEEALEIYPKMKLLKHENGIILFTPSEKTEAAVISKFLFEKGVVISHINVRKKSLEKHFLELIKRSNG